MNVFKWQGINGKWRVPLNFKAGDSIAVLLKGPGFHIQAVIFACLLFQQSAFSLTLEEIRQRLGANAAMDTIDVWLTTTVNAGGYSFSSNTHIISKGPDKVWVEQDLPTGKQRMVRNGEKVQITDLKTGKKTTPDTPPELFTQTAAPSFLQDGQYLAPKSAGNNRYLVELAPGSDSTLLYRSYLFDAGINQVVELTQVGLMQDTTVTSMSYCGECSLPFLETMTIRAKVKGEESVIHMKYQNPVKPGNISEKLFEIK